MGTIDRPLYYFNVTFTILRNGELYGSGNMKTKNIDPNEQGLNKVRTSIIQKLHEMQIGFKYELIRIQGKRIPKEHYDVLEDKISLD